ncbi:galactokinase [Bacteroidota bacterium]
MDPTPIIKKFREIFGSDPNVYRSPGRINLIGEHTDYNDGFVLPAAIDKEVVFAVLPNGTSKLRYIAYDLHDRFNTGLDEINHSKKGWPNYLMGVTDQMKQRGHELGGYDCVFGSDIPIGAGLSSSAAIECCMAFALNDIFELNENKFDLVKLSLKAENEFVGLNCGIMDQFASMFGEADKVIRLDCRSLEYEYFRFLQEGLKIVLVDTNVSHSLASSEYNTRRQECEAGVDYLKKHDTGIESLRDVSNDLLEAHKDELDPIIYKRCAYVINENTRLVEGCGDLNQNDLESFGEKMYTTHDGLSNDYEVSCPELDFLVDMTRENTNIIGARMMGGGFGGCTINLVKEDYVEKFKEEVIAGYSKKFWKEPGIYLTRISGGTSRVN